MNRVEAYELLLISMNEYRDLLALDEESRNLSMMTRETTGEAGHLYVIDVSGERQEDGHVCIKGRVSDSNPHNFELIEESFLV